MNLTVPALAAVMLVGGFGGGYAGNGWMPSVEATSERHTGDRQDRDWDLYVKRDTVFMGGVTLLGLVAFGAGLSVLLTRNEGTPYKGRGVKMFLGGATATATTAWTFMIIACCASGTWVAFLPFMGFLLFGVIIALLGYGYLFEEWLKQMRQDSPTGSPQAEGKTLG